MVEEVDDRTKPAHLIKVTVSIFGRATPVVNWEFTQVSKQG